MVLQGRLVQHGDSLALLLESAVLEQLNINLDSKLDIVTDGDSIIVTVRDEERRAKLHRIMEEMNDEYGEVFKRLAE
ncbi:MAG TPA: AbrB/MazE/SpoVT family DNA-binding domain-containing protein [Chloroflexia bacterium]|nr:AbrB/MazE/SpoVT family DNA-binding domain-containing protein [Chloroflexia bacterium]